MASPTCCAAWRGDDRSGKSSSRLMEDLEPAVPAPVRPWRAAVVSSLAWKQEPGGPHRLKSVGLPPPAYLKNGIVASCTGCCARGKLLFGGDRNFAMPESAGATRVLSLPKRIIAGSNFAVALLDRFFQIPGTNPRTGSRNSGSELGIRHESHAGRPSTWTQGESLKRAWDHA